MSGLKRMIMGMLAALLLVALALVAFVYSGWYDVGADAPHSRPVLALLTTLRQRAIRAHAADIVVPPLDDPKLILKGAGQYAAMCTQCHLTPGQADSEIRPGLYPRPPNLTRLRVDPREAFWVIKHGIKMSAMPAWGGSHDDATIWSMVAFLQTLPGLSAAQYQAIVARAPPDDDMPAAHAAQGAGAANPAALPPSS